jgi:hypothetical protein
MALAHDVSLARPAAVTPQAYWVLGSALAAAFAVWAALLGRPDFPLDDAYITLHNAQVLRDGVDPNYGVSPLTGATSSVHLLLVTILAGIVGLAWAGAAAAWLSAGLYLSALLFVARRCALSPLETAALLIVGACGGMSAYHLLNGLETGLAMAAVAWAMALAAGPPTRLLPALLGLLPFVRPELTLLAAPLFVRQAWARWRNGAPRSIVGDVAVLTLIAAPWLAWLWIETGSFFPQSAAVKRAYFAEAALPGLVKAVIVLSDVGALAWQVGPLMLVLLVQGAMPAGRTAQAFIVAMMVLFGIAMPGGLHHNWNRYLYVLVPLLTTGLAYARAHPRHKEQRWPAGLLIASALYAMATAPLHVQRYVDGVAFTRTELAELADWVHRNLAEDAPIAVHDAGYLAFATDRRLIDVVGLKTPGSHPVHEALTAPSGGAGRGEALARILLDSQSEHFVLLREWDRIFAIAEGLRAAGVELTPVRVDGEYQVFRVRRSG